MNPRSIAIKEKLKSGYTDEQLLNHRSGKHSIPRNWTNVILTKTRRRRRRHSLLRGAVVGGGGQGECGR